MTRLLPRLLAPAFALILTLAGSPADAQSQLPTHSGTEEARLQIPHASKYVILISVDGLRPDAITRSRESQLPAFHRLRRQSAFTDNARTDYHVSNTLPNHAGILTGRPVQGANGHNWVLNEEAADGVTLHSNKGAYVASVFDVVHDDGRSTAAYVSKSKFALFDVSYDERNGAADVIGADNGRDKIDVFEYDADTERLVSTMIDDLTSAPTAFTFLHLADPDLAGHSRTWSLRRGSHYMNAVERVDGLVGRLLETIEDDPELSGQTTVILTADHGGSWWSHRNETTRSAYTVPFYVWGAGVQAGDLYELNDGLVHDPGHGRPAYNAAAQPIRNASAANLALSLLGLPDVPGSSVGSHLAVGPSPSENDSLAADTTRAGAGSPIRAR